VDIYVRPPKVPLACTGRTLIVPTYGVTCIAKVCVVIMQKLQALQVIFRHNRFLSRNLNCVQLLCEKCRSCCSGNKLRETAKFAYMLECQ
jgi:hypothetical protein